MSVRILPLSVTCTFFNLVAISPLVAAQNPGSASADAENMTLPEVRVVAGRTFYPASWELYVIPGTGRSVVTSLRLDI